MVQLGRGEKVVVGVKGGMERVKLGEVLVLVGVVDLGVEVPVRGAVPVPRQTPMHASVGVQKALVGQEEDGPTSQGIVGRFAVPGGGARRDALSAARCCDASCAILGGRAC